MGVGDLWGGGVCQSTRWGQRVLTPNTSSPTTGVTFPSGEAQEVLIRSLYQPGGVAPESLEYIEAHGTGTKVKTLHPAHACASPAPLERLLAGVLTSPIPYRWATPRN